MRERFSLKDHLFNVEKVSYLGGLLEEAIAGFDRARFSTRVANPSEERGPDAMRVLGYSGQRRLSILVNGREPASTEFEVTTR